MVQRVTVAGQVQRRSLLLSWRVYACGTWITGLTPQAGGGNLRATSYRHRYRGICRSRAPLAQTVVIGLLSASDSWVTGCAIAPNPGRGWRLRHFPIDSRNITIRNNWIDRVARQTAEKHVRNLTASVSWKHQPALFENNILVGLYSPIVMNGGASGNVVAYNYENHVTGAAGEGSSFHEEGEQMNLYEGNYLIKVWADCVSRNGNFNTMFRNQCSVRTLASMSGPFIGGGTSSGTSSSTTYKALASGATKYSRWCGVAIRLGYASQHGDDPPCAVGAPYPSGGMEPTGNVS